MSLNNFKISQKHNLFHNTKDDHHLLHYLLLLFGLSVFLFFMLYFKYNPLGQLATAFCSSVFYAVWGILHHYFENRLTLLIALEYILMSSIVFLMFFLVLV